MILINIFRYLSFYPRLTKWPTPVGYRGPYSPDPLRRFAPRFLVGILFCIILGSLRVPPRERSANSPVGFCSEQPPVGGTIMLYLNRAISKQPSGLLQRAVSRRTILQRHSRPDRESPSCLRKRVSVRTARHCSSSLKNTKPLSTAISILFCFRTIWRAQGL